MSLDIDQLQQELEAINAERETTSQRIELFSQRGRGRGRGRGFIPGGRGAHTFGDRAGPSSEGLSKGLRERLGGRGEDSASRRSALTERRGTFEDRGDARGGRYDRYQPQDEEAAPVQEEPLPGSNKGRLASAIVVDAAQQDEEEPGTARRPQENGAANPAVKQRNKRLFGSLLGTLAKFQEEDQRFKRSRLAQTRADAEQRAEQRAVVEAEKLREKQRQDLAKARLAELNKKRQLDLKVQAKQHEIMMARKLERELKLAGWLKTVAQPSLLWLPKEHSEDTQLLLEQRQIDLDAWKVAQLAKLEAAKAQIEGRFKPIPPRPTRPQDAETPAAATSQEPAAEDMQTEEKEAGEAFASQEQPEMDRYEAADDGLEEGGEPEDLIGNGEISGIKDLLQ